MGINPPSLYAAFGNKEGLFRKALDRYVERHDEFLREALARPKARDGIAALLNKTVDALTDNQLRQAASLCRGSPGPAIMPKCIRDQLSARRAANREDNSRAIEAGKG